MEGHNSNSQLKSIVERIEHELDAISELRTGVKEIFAEAKSNGYDVKALRAIIRRRAQDQNKLAEHEALVDTYEAALG